MKKKEEKTHCIMAGFKKITCFQFAFQCILYIYILSYILRNFMFFNDETYIYIKVYMILFEIGIQTGLF